MGIGLPRQQDLALERSSPNFLMDLSSLFFDGGRGREGKDRSVFLSMNNSSDSVYSLCLVLWGPIQLNEETFLAVRVRSAQNLCGPHKPQTRRENRLKTAFSALPRNFLLPAGNFLLPAETSV